MSLLSLPTFTAHPLTPKQRTLSPARSFPPQNATLSFSGLARDEVRFSGKKPALLDYTALDRRMSPEDRTIYERVEKQWRQLSEDSHTFEAVARRIAEVPEIYLVPDEKRPAFEETLRRAGLAALLDNSLIDAGTIPRRDNNRSAIFFKDKPEFRQFPGLKVHALKHELFHALHNIYPETSLVSRTLSLEEQVRVRTCYEALTGLVASANPLEAVVDIIPREGDAEKLQIRDRDELIKRLAALYSPRLDLKEMGRSVDTLQSTQERQALKRMLLSEMIAYELGGREAVHAPLREAATSEEEKAEMEGIQASSFMMASLYRQMLIAVNLAMDLADIRVGRFPA